MNNDYISHHGILGTHWGYRKADNVDTNKDSFALRKEPLFTVRHIIKNRTLEVDMRLLNLVTLNIMPNRI